MNYINYDMLFNGTEFMVAFQSSKDWQWSRTEQSPPYSIVLNVPMHRADVNYQVEVMSGVFVWASQIDESLIQTQE